MTFDLIPILALCLGGWLIGAFCGYVVGHIHSRRAHADRIGHLEQQLLECAQVDALRAAGTVVAPPITKPHEHKFPLFPTRTKTPWDFWACQACGHEQARRKGSH